jgi:hypothetical protein
VLTSSPRAYSSGSGASYFPRHSFRSGETVTLTVDRDNGGKRSHVAYRFTIAVPGQPTASPMPPPAPNNKLNAQSFASRPDLHPTNFSVTTHNPGASTGDLFLAPIRGPGPSGPMFGQYGPLILDGSGQPVWFYPAPAGNEDFGLRVQTYHDAPVLTWWQGQLSPLGVGYGKNVVYDQAYRRVATVSAGNGLKADLHEFLITPQNTALLTAFVPVTRDLRPYGGPSRAVMWDSVVQEIDIPTGRVMYEWHALGHVSFTNTYSPFSANVTWDPYHLNSIQQTDDGNLLLSFRNAWAGYEINKATGRTMWRLGGKKSTFALGKGVRFAWQHDIELRGNSVVSLFDDEAGPPSESSQSRGELIKLDTTHKTATLVGAITHAPATLALSQGNADLQPNGNLLVGWGASPYVSEYASSGALQFDGKFVPPIESYRAYRHDWSGHPTQPPAIAVIAAGSGHSTAYASWNGATDVAGWQLVAGASPNSLQPVGPAVARSGFETTIANAATTGPYFAVQALRALPPAGQSAPPSLVSGTSPTIKN